MEIIAIPAFQDNYIWLLHDGRHALVVDPGDAAPVLETLERLQLNLTAVLLTHHHNDHVGGVEALVARHPSPVYGPASPLIPGLSQSVADGARISCGEFGLTLEVLAVPGHTATHLAYLGPDFVFCGDTLFCAGCGRIFDGTGDQLFASLQRLAALPGETRVYCTHEYTLSNLAFCRAVEPENPDRDRFAAEAAGLREQGVPTLPSSIARERRINPFLRTAEPAVREAVATQAGVAAVQDDCSTFKALRAWKDVFRS